jgi:hypothetical protein
VNIIIDDVFNDHKNDDGHDDDQFLSEISDDNFLDPDDEELQSDNKDVTDDESFVDHTDVKSVDVDDLPMSDSEDASSHKHEC